MMLSIVAVSSKEKEEKESLEERSVILRDEAGKAASKEL
jgi:hypothetical protein